MRQGRRQAAMNKGVTTVPDTVVSEEGEGTGNTSGTTRLKGSCGHAKDPTTLGILGSFPAPDGGAPLVRHPHTHLV